ncbi:MAG: TonB-dependent receptor [Acidobacteria bacterium]|nr:TonB-dependent receptor [Acidobacteriota bacterium]
MRNLRSLTVGVLALLALGALAAAQGGATGAISGTVTDISGAVVAGAQVQIINQDTAAVARTLKTDANGAFTAPLLPVATYSVKVAATGLGEGNFKDIAVRITETTRLTAKLAPLKVMEKVEVQATVQTIETTTATTGQAIEEQTIRELPLASQNFQQLLTLSTGAQSELNASAQLGRGNARVIVNGQREDNNNYLIEGISATDYNVSQSTNVPLPNPDVIEEFKVQTSLYDASQGRNSGGNVNAILKSGTKSFHGDAYEFFRNDVLNANEFFLNRAGLKRPPVKQNIFGGSLGGPLGPFGFFFVNYQGTRQRSGLSPGTLISTSLPILPADRSPENLAAIFSTPASANCAANPISIDDVSLALFNLKSGQFGGDANGFLFPSLPGTPGVTVDDATCNASVNTAQFIISKPGKFTDDQFTTTWDKEFNSGNDKLGARFFFSNNESLLPFGAGGLQASLGGTLASSISATDLNFPYDLPVNSRFLSIAETHLFSPALVNDFRFGFVRINNSLINVAPGGVTADAVGIDRPTSNITNSIYKFTLGSSGIQIGPTPPADQAQTQNNFNFVETLSWVKGKHTFRFGGEYTRVNLDKLFPQVFNGQLFFVNTAGVAPPAGAIDGGVPGGIGGQTDFQKLLSGQVDFSFGGGGVYNHQYRTNNFSFFAQDDWKVNQQFTLNLGLRTELIGAFHDNLCHIGNFDLDLANAGQYPLIYGGCANKLGVEGMTGSGNDTTLKNNYSTGLGPRIGFAWDVFGHHNTTIRGGFGDYFVREDVGTVDQLSFQAPILPIAFSGGPAGCMAQFFKIDRTPTNSCPDPQPNNPNGLPAASTKIIDPNFLPCLGTIQNFPDGDTTQFPNIGCAAGSPGVVPSQFLFALAVPRHFVAPHTQQWNLTMQRDLGKNWVLEVGYIGTHAIHLRETRTNVQARLATAANPLTIQTLDGPATITSSTAANGPARSTLTGVNGYSGMQLFANDAYSHYHSFQTTLSRRWGAGYFQSAYTFARSTDATSSGNTALNTAFNDESDLRFSRGLSDYDRKHRLTVSYRYELPFFSSATGAKRWILADWAISGITIFQSGTPFSVTDSGAGTAYLGAGLASATLGAQLADGGSIGAGRTSGDIHDRLDQYLNPANFVPAPPADPAGCNADPTGAACTTSFGNLGRNIYRGPFQQNWDFSLIKNFRIGEKQSLRFTADFFNIWNHANFSSPTLNDVENPGAFGKIFSTVGTPRLVQLQLRYSF